MKKQVLITAVVLAMLGLQASPASANSDSTGSSWTSSAYAQANAWQCNTYWDKCSWVTSSKAFESNGSTSRTVTWIENTATINVVGLNASLSVSVPRSITIDGSGTKQSFRWRNNMNWIADMNGVSDPSYNSVWLRTCSEIDGFSNSLGRSAPQLSACAGT